MTPLVLLPTEAAALLQCSKPTFYRWARRPDFPRPAKISGSRQRRYFVADLAAWLRRQQLTPAGVLPPPTLSPSGQATSLGPRASGAGAPALSQEEA